MKRKIYLLALILLAGPAVWAIPSQITYQGTLKDKGLPANSPPNNYAMTFQLTDQSGNTPYSDVISNPQVPVINGLFSVQLGFHLLTAYTWDTISPYLKVTVNGQALSPTEPVNATAYAIVSNTVVDGAVTTPKVADGAITSAKVASGFGLVPSGAIIMFDTNCPAGWTRFSALDNVFPMGSATYGTTGGSSTHSHSISSDGAHNHGGVTGPPIGKVVVNAGPNALIPNEGHTHSISTDGAHNHGGATGSASNLPPYLSVIYCQKS